MKKRLLSALLAFIFISACIPAAYAEESNADIIYTFLTDYMGLNSAAACGVLANIERESGFRPDALGDGGTSYGICQWHDVSEGVGRYTSLKNFCSERGMDYTELMSQLYYLEFELKTWYPKVWNALYSVENSADGAYEAGYYWCFNFEVPAKREERSVERGNLAKDKYWPLYNEEEPDIGVHEVWKVTAEPHLNVRTGPDTSYPKSGAYETGTEIRVTEISKSTNYLWGKTDIGWCVIYSFIENEPYCEYVSGALYSVNYITGCSVSMEPQDKHIGEELALSSAEGLFKHGYTFGGWAVEKDKDAVYPAQGGVYSENASLTLYGVWTRDESIAFIAGDVNCDGVFNLKDASVLIKYLAGYDVSFELAASDVNGDSKTDMKDVSRMIRKLASWDVEICEPVETPAENQEDTQTE